MIGLFSVLAATTAVAVPLATSKKASVEVNKIQQKTYFDNYSEKEFDNLTNNAIDYQAKLDIESVVLNYRFTRNRSDVSNDLLKQDIQKIITNNLFDNDIELKKDLINSNDYIEIEQEILNGIVETAENIEDEIVFAKHGSIFKRHFWDTVNQKIKIAAINILSFFEAFWYIGEIAAAIMTIISPTSGIASVAGGIFTGFRAVAAMSSLVINNQPPVVTEHVTENDLKIFENNSKIILDSFTFISPLSMSLFAREGLKAVDWRAKTKCTSKFSMWGIKF